ncbi:MAG: histidine kinase [Rhodobacteraceae bacterium]|nr:histidine kinase [Paracoccaceae bacterium]
MSGKIIGSLIVAIALIAGISLYYLQVYYYYDEVAADAVDIRLTPVQGGAPESIPAVVLGAIDANSSPIRFRACFTTPLSQAMLTETYRIYDDAEPLTAPGWFDCFDAGDIGAALEDGRAIAFLGEADIAHGVDRIVAVFDDGRAFAWHQLNSEFKD